ncbi:efflux transporter, RND family, MFP subunit [Treponema primitia ZAS-2]|uniref:Efflux transporter, RND family, MFP subunit n=1 Tax=Treponema primitia (strain ATCC BAA-887 / DSM 12427 / ZAS-2) TaxID=545694 RepID=F5YQM4_TREPZ|nr:efflux RND transporter periplasmic adaptor subunit [Treponema primitia]AEF84935.1 efflux transporter, RND family, MFP subunit [Treponema primitia ZAS-2]
MRNAFLLIPALAVLLAACSAGKDNLAEAKSMEQLYSENGFPVRVRRLEPEDFSVYLKYPTVLDAQSESTAYASLSDVVRNIAVKVGDQVKQDQVILSFSENNRTLQQARLSYENAEAAYKRSEVLYATSDISRQDFDNSRMQYELARASLDAARDMIYVKAPIAGTLIHLNVRATENVNPGTPLFTVSNQNGLVTRFYVGVNEINLIKNGARVYIDGLESVDISNFNWKLNSQQVTFDGRVSQVALLMDSRKRAFPVSAFFDITDLMALNQARPFISGMSIDIVVETYRNEKALVVSRKELLKTDSGYAAYVARDNKAQRVDVQVGHERGLDFEITGGLESGDLLIYDGIQSLSDNIKLNIVETAQAVTR